MTTPQHPAHHAIANILEDPRVSAPATPAATDAAASAATATQPSHRSVAAVGGGAAETAASSSFAAANYLASFPPFAGPGQQAASTASYAWNPAGAYATPCPEARRYEDQIRRLCLDSVELFDDVPIAWRLYAARQFWQNVLHAPPSVLSVIEDGYRLPFYREPQPFSARNSRTTEQYSEFVTTEIARWWLQG